MVKFAEIMQKIKIKIFFPKKEKKNYKSSRCASGRQVKDQAPTKQCAPRKNNFFLLPSVYGKKFF